MSTRPAPRGLVYVLTTPDGKEYVGQTAGPMWQRLVRHRRDAQRSPERPICAAFLEHGQAAIKVTIVASGIAERAERVAIEARLIAERDTLYPNGLNILPAADVIEHLHTAQSRKKAAEGLRRFARENPDVIKARVEHARTPENRAKASTRCSERNADPEFQAKVHNKLRETRKTPEWQAKVKAAGQQRAKLKDEMLDDILLALIEGESKNSISRRYGVTHAAINLFLKRNVTA